MALNALTVLRGMFRGRGASDRKSYVADPLAAFAEVFATPAAKSGVSVNHYTAMQCGVAMACARVISEGLSQVPFRLMRADGVRREAATDNPLWDLFENAPNEWQTAPEFFDTIGMHLSFAGNAYVWVNRVSGRVRELLPVEPRFVQVKRRGWQLEYLITDDQGHTLSVPPGEVWHLRGPSWNGYLGLDGVRVAREALGIAIASEEHAASTLQNGGAPAGILTTDAALSEEQRKQLRASWQAVHGGRVNAGRIAVMSNGLKFIPVGSSAVDAQLIQTRQFAIEEVCRAFRVMPIMVGYSDKASTYASAEQMFLAHIVHTMGPWYRRIEKSAGASLLTREDREQGLYFKFFANALLRGAARDRAEFYRTMVTNGLLSPNEVRELEDMNPYEGGDAFTRQINMGAVGSDGDTEGVTDGSSDV
jgi:HK97 family phage portal protein